jgi:hypothetical protein
MLIFFKSILIFQIIEIIYIQMNSIKTDKETVCKFLKKLNSELISVINDMKMDFEKNPP